MCTLKFEQTFYRRVIPSKDADRVANSEDPDQTVPADCPNSFLSKKLRVIKVGSKQLPVLELAKAHMVMVYLSYLL